MNESELNERIKQFPLTERSIVWIAGAHRGEQVRFFLEHYPCEVWAFEPQVDAFNDMLRGIQSDRLTAYNFGLGEATDTRAMCHTGGLGATYMLDGSPTIETQLVSILHFMNKRDYPIYSVSLFLLNVEGYEFILLPYMIESGVIRRFQSLMVQFHPHHASATTYQRVRDEMMQSHILEWEYGNGLWTFWSKRSST